MGKDLYKRLEPIISEALELAEEDRDAFLVSRIGDEPELLALARELVAGHISTDDFLEQPFLDAVARASATDTELREDLEGMADYRVIEMLGEGGMGLVYRARQHADIEREVAIKIIRDDFAGREILKRFTYERHVLGRMSHPNIAQIFDAGKTPNGRPYFTMEYVRGRQIDLWAEQTRADLDQRLVLFEAICGAVAHAHHRAVIHRDLKPSNILVTEVNGRPVPKIIDFGIARSIDPMQDPERTRLGQILGTPAFMAPEQVEPNLGIDTRTDVYGLGCVLYVLLTGRTPLDPERLSAMSRREAMRVILEDNPASPSRVAVADGPIPARALRGDLDRIVGKALARDKARRYSTASELADDLARYRTNQPIAARSPSPAYVIGKLIRRHRFATIVFLLALLGLVGFAVTLELKNAEIAAQRETAEASFDYLRELISDASRVGHGSRITLLEAVRLKEPDVYALPRSVRLPMLRIHGDVYHDHDELEDAARCFRRLRDETHGKPGLAREYLWGLIGSMRVAIASEDFSSAESFAKPAEPLLARLDDAGLTFLYKRTRASALLQQARYEEAEAGYRALIDAFTPIFGPGDWGLEVARRGLGVVLYNQNELREATSLLETSADRLAAHYGPDHPDTLKSREELANVLKRDNQLKRALSVYRDCYTRRVKTDSATHPDTVSARLNIVRTLLDLDEVTPVLEDMAALEKALIEAGLSDELLIARALHALALKKSGQRAEALTIYEDVTPRMVEAFGPGDPETLRAINNQANLIREEDPARAAELLAEVLNDLPERQKTSRAVIFMRITLGESLFQADQLDAAAACFADLETDLGSVSGSPILVRYTRVYSALIDHRKGDPDALGSLSRENLPEELTRLIEAEINR